MTPVLRRGVRLCLAVYLATALSALSGSARAANIVVGTPFDQNFIPFGGLTTELTSLVDDPDDPLTVLRFQQAYNANEFGEDTVEIGGVEFYATDFQFMNAGLLGGSFTITLSTSTQPVQDLNCCNTSSDPMMNSFDQNMGADQSVLEADVFLDDNFSDDVLRFSGPGFFFDPSSGFPLLVDVRVEGFEDSDDLTRMMNLLFFEQTDVTEIGGGDSCQVNTVDVWSTVNDNACRGLVTGFHLVPEPTTGLLTVAGLVGLAAGRRRRRL